MELVGVASASLASCANIPQIYKTWKSGSSDDISTYTLCVMHIATFLGIIYGALIKHVAVYAGNSVSFVLFIVLHAVKIRNSKRALAHPYVTDVLDPLTDGESSV